jgi:isopenicillin-N epimerase
LVVSWGYEAEIPGPSRFFDQHEWTGTRDIAAFLSVPAAIDFQQEFDWATVRHACHELVYEAQMKICALTHLSPLSSSSWFVQLATAPLPESTDLEALKIKLYDENRIEVPLISWNGRKLIRVSVQGYNTRRDVGKLVKALSESGLEKHSGYTCP